MFLSRSLSRPLLTVLATLWAGVFVSAGRWILAAGAAVTLSRHTRLGLAVAALAAGVFLFMVLVADRWFPKADRRLVDPIEAATFAAFLGGLLWPFLHWTLRAVAHA